MRSHRSKKTPTASPSSGEAFSVRTLSRTTFPPIPFQKIKERVLGPSFEVSLVLVGDSLARRLNKERRNKTYAANVLTFPISENAGEIFLNIRKAAQEARRYGNTHRSWLILLFIHGLLHLKGMEHGSTMESTEDRLLREFDR